MLSEATLIFETIKNNSPIESYTEINRKSIKSRPPVFLTPFRKSAVIKDCFKQNYRLFEF